MNSPRNIRTVDRVSKRKTKTMANAMAEWLHIVAASPPREQQQAQSLLDQLPLSVRQVASQSRPAAPSTRPEGTRADAAAWVCVQAQWLLHSGQQW